jgi:NAD(P)-dependent dehydrogenase (short-subunit alcohol dehydrogenase family)
MALADQVSVNSGFGAKSTGAEVVAGLPLQGRRAIVTGGYSGIGLETVRALAKQGARVMVPVRDRAKAGPALSAVSGEVEMADMDLADLASVRRFVDNFKASHTHLDLLINNAGIMACPETRIGPSWEAQFGTNHLGHMALTLGLMDLLQRAADARVVALSSTGHKISGIRWDDPHFNSAPYEKWQAYGQSKTANALFANALSRRLKPTGGHAFSVHPGGIFTPLQRHLGIEEQVRLGWVNPDGSPSELAQAGFKSTEQGCATTLWAATSAALVGKPGVYCEDCDVAAPTVVGSPYARFRGVEAHACDDAAAERLWELSVKMLA